MNISAPVFIARRHIYIYIDSTCFFTFKKSLKFELDQNIHQLGKPYSFALVNIVASKHSHFKATKLITLDPSRTSQLRVNGHVLLIARWMQMIQMQKFNTKIHWTKRVGRNSMSVGNLEQSLWNCVDGLTLGMDFEDFLGQQDFCWEEILCGVFAFHHVGPKPPLLESRQNRMLGGGFKCVFFLMFTPIWGRCPIWRLHIFQMGGSTTN